MTNGILTSINAKNILYTISLQADSQNEKFFNRLKAEFKQYRDTLRCSIKEAKH